MYIYIYRRLDRLTWTYSITLRLLPDHPSRPSNLIHCRLLSRHWIIRNYEDDSMISEDVVDGEGVIGLFPVLKISDNFDK